MTWLRSSKHDGAPEYWAPRPRRATRRVAFGLLGAVGVGLAVMAQGPSDAAVPDVAEAAPPRPVWVDVGRPLELYAVDRVDLPQAAAYEARRHEPGGGRRDVLSYGRVGETAYLRIAFYRRGGEAAPETTLFVEAARRAAEVGFSARSASTSDAVTTRFGAFEVADLTIERGETQAQCLAFRLTAGEDVLRISGLSCGAGGASVDRATLACQLDRIDLRAAGEDAALRAIFVAAERKRDLRCAPARQQGAKTSWLEPHGAPPALRGSREAPAPTPARRNPR